MWVARALKRLDNERKPIGHSPDRQEREAASAPFHSDSTAQPCYWLPHFLFSKSVAFLQKTSGHKRGMLLATGRGNGAHRIEY